MESIRNFIGNSCSMNMIINAIFKGDHSKHYRFLWDTIESYQGTFNESYNDNDAKFLLQLSLMISTEENLTTIPSFFENTVLMYDNCPSYLIAESIPNSYLNKPASLGNVLYDTRYNILYLVFRSTSNVCLAATDLSYYQVELTDILNYIPGVKGHGGIYSAYQSIRLKLINAFKLYLNRHPKIVITGYSLGGGISQLCGLDLSYYNPIQYSFGSPMIFNQNGASVFDKFVKSAFRIANISDLVTISPLPVMPNKDAFCHVGQFIYFQRNFGDSILNHSLAYVQEYDLPYVPK